MQPSHIRPKLSNGDTLTDHPHLAVQRWNATLCFEVVCNEMKVWELRNSGKTAFEEEVGKWPSKQGLVWGSLVPEGGHDMRAIEIESFQKLHRSFLRM